jgi:transcriptional regulator with XRE-family HTH domain
VQQPPAQRLADQVGRLLQAARAKARMTQSRLAEHAGSTQQWVSKVERGVVDVRLSDAERLFEAARVRLVVQAVRPCEKATADPDLLGGCDATADGQAAVLARELSAFSHVLRLFTSVGFVVGGRFAALAQDVPVRPYRLDLIIAEADVEAATDALAMASAMRWSDRLQDFALFDVDVSRPGARRWRAAGLFELSIDVVPELPAQLIVATRDRTLPVVPLTVLLREDADVAELCGRLNASTSAES